MDVLASSWRSRLAPPYAQSLSDEHSEILAGNLRCEYSSDANSDNDEYDSTDEFENSGKLDIDSLSLTDLDTADQMLKDALGTTYSIRKFIVLIIQNKISVTDILVQALCYRVQRCVDGGYSVRYHPSYGMFWAGIRNLIKSRGLIAFKEHIPIPSDLGKFTKQIYKMCGLDEKTLGNSGVQKSNIDIWINTKIAERKGEVIPVSLSIDGKKIVSSSSGAEDLAGLDCGINASHEEMVQRLEKDEMLRLVDSLDVKEECYKLYDILTNETFKLMKKLIAVNRLILTNSKRVERNPNLNRYLYVLNEQKVEGFHLVKLIQNVQVELIKRISISRNCTELLPSINKSLSLAEQKNYYKLENLDSSQEKVFCRIVDEECKKRPDLLSISWNFMLKIPLNLSCVKRGSILFNKLYGMCYLKDDQFYGACGLSKQRPLAEMKAIYKDSHMPSSSINQTLQWHQEDSIRFLLSSHFAPMTFGNNLVLKECGIFIKSGVGSAPDLIVCKGEQIEFSIKIYRVEIDTFHISEEVMVSALVSSFTVDARRGCLVVLCSNETMVVHSIPRNDDLLSKMKRLIDSYLLSTREIQRRNAEMLNEIELVRREVESGLLDVTILGSYPLLNSYLPQPHSQDKQRVFAHQSRLHPASNLISKSAIREELLNYVEGSRKFLVKQARELVVVNISDISGSVSSVPHTILAASYLSGSSLKTIVKDCLVATEKHLDESKVQVVNIAVDGESLHLATVLSDGSPGTELQLAKCTMKTLDKFSKTELVDLISRNEQIKLSEDVHQFGEVFESDFDVHDNCMNAPDLLNFVNESIATNCVSEKEAPISIEEIEDLLKSNTCSANIDERKEKCRRLSVRNLRKMCLGVVFPTVKKKWLTAAYHSSLIQIKFENQTFSYSPNTVFLKKGGYFKTVTFDTAHIVNLLRESAAKGKLYELGLSIDVLNELSKVKKFNYLQNILKLKNGSLMYDSMNQSSSYMLFSKFTEEGLISIGDKSGALCCKLIREGLIESLDSSGQSSYDRCKKIIALKAFLERKIDILDKIRRPGDHQISSELIQMIYCSLDSHIVSYINCEFFNPRRKSTGSVEQFFSQITLMNDGGFKLNCVAITDILKRVTLTNSLRLMPNSVKGFSFLKYLNVHMKSYCVRIEDYEHLKQEVVYPKLKKTPRAGLVIVPIDSMFDTKNSKKRKLYRNAKVSEDALFTGNVRKFHRKF